MPKLVSISEQIFGSESSAGIIIGSRLMIKTLPGCTRMLPSCAFQFIWRSRFADIQAPIELDPKWQKRSI